MLDRAGEENDLFRFSTTMFQWEQLDAARVSSSPASARQGHAMVAVGNDLIVFGGRTGSGEDARLLATVWGHVRLDRAIEYVVYFPQNFPRIFWYTLHRKSSPIRTPTFLLRGFPVCTTTTSSN